ncbi:MAG: hypothetical protein LDL41_16990, partial [Coleofasciculus sp. S288]|nr:hypothetical protein [Coleofasciculus sp. S288]
NVTTEQFRVERGAQASVSSRGNGSAGGLEVRSRGVVLDNGKLTAQTISGSGGNITLGGLDTQRSLESLQLSNGSEVSTSTVNGSQGGTVTVRTARSVELTGGSSLSAEATMGGNAGGLQIITNQFALDGAQATVSSTGTGTAGNLEVQARDVVLSNQSRLAATTEAGSGGNIALNGLQTLQVNNSLITASTQSGRAGDVSVNARESVRLQGALANGSPGGIAVEATAARGNAGEVRLNTRQLSLYDSQISASNVSGVSEGIRLEGLDTLTANNSLISASTETGTAGSLVVEATEVVELSGAGGLSVGATSGGIAGDLSVETDRMTLRNGAQVTVSSPQGQAGNLSITSNTLSLLQGSLRAETGTSGDRGGANITLDGLDVLLLSNESLISANALEDANGGNITVDSRYIIALTPRGLQGSDIVANAVRGNGGRVNITARAGILGIEFRSIRTSENDITASSEFGFAGSVTITRPNIDPSRGLAQLPSDLVDATQLVDRSCSSAGENLADNRFIITGRGGLPPNPAETLGEEGLLEDLGSSAGMGNEKQGIGSVAPIASSHIPSVQIIEARGWMKTADGQVMLVAEVPSATGWRSWLTYPSCQGSRLLPLE